MPRPRHTLGLEAGGLTPRELAVLAAVASGKRSRAVAGELGVTEATVKTHLYRIYRKLGVGNPVGASAWYLQNHPPAVQRRR